MFNIKRYQKKNWNKVIHTTWNPKGPGSVRIHMVPPKFSWFNNVPAIIIINGMNLLPINPSWAILLTEFAENVNDYENQEIDDNAYNQIVTNTLKNVIKIYPLVKNERLKKDLDTIIATITDIAYNKIPEIEVGVIKIGNYGPFMSAPHRMDLLVSAMEKEGKWNCNQKCIHCYATGQENANVAEIDTSSWIKIIEKCRDAKIAQLTFTGGEPTVRKDLIELISAAKWFVTRLNTNGLLLDQPYCDALFEAELDSVQITFYDANQENHNILVGGKHYAKVVDGIKNALASKLSVSINTPLCKTNKNYKDTLKFLNGLGIKYVTCSGMIVSGNATTKSSTELQLSADELYEVLKEAKKYVDENEMEMNFTSPGWISDDKLSELGLNVPSCGACLSNMAIAPNGLVIPCQSWLSDISLGNMLTDEWKKIWNHKECLNIRKQSQKMQQECPLKNKWEANK